jgi:hypothetical protein
LVAREGINLCWDDVRIYLLARGIRNFDKEAIIKQSQRLDPELAISELLTRLAKQQLRLIRQRELDKVDALFWETGRLRQALMEARTKFESAQRLHAGQAVSKTDLLENYYLPYRITEQRVVEAERRMARLVGDQPEIVEE